MGSAIREYATYWLPLVSAVLILAISAWAATVWVNLLVESEKEERNKLHGEDPDDE